MTSRTGITTGACAAAAAKAAAMALCGQGAADAVAIRLPSGQTLRVPVDRVSLLTGGGCASAVVRKDAGDDPDVTHGAEIRATVSWSAVPAGELRAGEGVGIVTKPGLQVPPGEPAINPGPRGMISEAVREITDRPVCVEIAIPGGEALAAKTFNPRLGIVGGLSILGTTGIVRPHYVEAIRETMRCALDVAKACGVSRPVAVPGNIGARAARARFRLQSEQVIEVGNEWGFFLSAVPGYAFDALLVAGHPGKLAKLITGERDTHSARSASAVDIVRTAGVRLFGGAPPTSTTVEGLFGGLPPDAAHRLGKAVAEEIRVAIANTLGETAAAAVYLVNMRGEQLGVAGDLRPWE